jgi:hypothetical protein
MVILRKIAASENNTVHAYGNERRIKVSQLLMEFEFWDSPLF